MSEPSRRAGLSADKLELLRRRLGGDATAAPQRDAITRRAGPGPVHPISFAQRRMWFVAQYHPSSPMHHVPTAELMTADVNVDALERAYTLVVRRHESLRTVFRTIDGELRQVVLDPFPVKVEARDHRAEVSSRADVMRLVAEEGARPFDLENGPLLRVALLRVSDERCALVTTLHHIVTDGWSMLVLGREVDAFYGDFVAGREPSRPEPPIRYADYAVWQREWLSGATLENQLAYWRGALEGAPTLDLPTDRPRPAEQSFRGGMHTFRLPAALAGALRQVAREEAATLNMVLLAGIATLLGKWAGQDDVVVGTVFSNRNRPEVEELVGFLANTAALRLDLSGDPSFRAAVRTAKRAVLGADAHQELPFETLVDELKLERDLSRQALFQVMYFHHANVGGTGGVEGGLAKRHDAKLLDEANPAGLLDMGAAQFDLTLTTTELEDGGVGAVMEYAADLFEPATMARLARQLTTLLEAASTRPDAPLSALPLMGEAERRRVVAEWNATSSETPRAPWHRLFESVVERAPEATAVIASDGSAWTFAELNARANRLARRLAALGVGPESLVAVSLERAPETVAALLAVAKAGGAFLPVDPAYPAERRRWMLEDSAARVVLTTSTLAADLPETASTVIALDAIASEIESESDANLPVEVDAENAAYVIFTSGSTGRPKGVVVTHRGVGNLAVAQARAFGIEPGARVLQMASLSFDAAVAEMAHTLLSGAALVLADPERSAGPELVGFLREREVDVATIPPALLAALPDADLPSLRTVVSAGEAVPADVVERWGAGRRFVNAYGPTETTVCATVAVDPSTANGRVPIGRPIENVRVYVVDPAMRPLPACVPGELCVGGIGLARGYLGRAGETAARFVPDPFSTPPGARLYRTGDRARWTEAGELEFLGRLDAQVKVRGFRIELGEIEHALLSHPSVSSAVATVREDEPGRPRLVAYAVPSAGSTADEAELRAHLRARLPDYMVPAALVVLDALPLTPSGKVDRRALPAPSAPAATAAGFVAPRGPVEEALARVWADVLRRDQVGASDNFFALGGDSILSIQVIVRAAREGIRVTPRQIFQHPTIAELAAAAVEAAGTDAGQPARAEQGAVTGDVPLTPLQRWFFARDLPAASHWNMGLLLEARAPLDADLLSRAAGAVLAHHDALRTRFERTADGWRASIDAPGADPSIERFDLSAVDGDADAEIERRATEIHASLDLAAGPLMRVALFDLGANRQRVLLAFHHLVTDAVSLPVIAEDFETAYRQLAAGGDVNLPPKTTSFRDWARRLETHAVSDRMREEADFWLAAVPTSIDAIPVDSPDAPDTEGSTAAALAELSEDETRALLEAVPAAYGTQVNDALLAALAEAYSAWSGRGALLVDVEGHGREELFGDVDLSRTVGWFTTQFPVLLTQTGDAGETLKAVKETLRAVPERGIGYGLLRWMGDAEIAAELATRPQAEVGFNYLGRVTAGEESDGILAPAAGPIGVTRAAQAPRPHRLAVEGAVVGGRLRMAIHYGAAVYRAETVERLARAYESALRALVAHCRESGVGGFTPSDFPAARLDQPALDALVPRLLSAPVDGGEERIAASARERIEDVYPLTDLQQGMLFHALQAPGSAAYAEHMVLEMEGEVRPDAFAAAWRAVFDATPALRALPVWTGVPRPLQAVFRRVELPFAHHDWSALPAAEAERCWAELLEDDRTRGWEWDRAPLVRCTLAKVKAGDWRFLFSFHHLLLDGWSMALVLGDFGAAYAALLAGGAPVPPRRPLFRGYLEWLARRDAGAAEAFWRARLAGVEEPTPLPLDRAPSLAGRAAEEHGRESLELPAGVWSAATEAARRHHVTPNTLAKAAWAAVLARYAGRDEVVFGATVAGRPPELAGVERMVGIFINTVPVRAAVPARGPVAPWLRALQDDEAEARQFEDAPLSQMRAWSGIQGDAPLFETLFVFENYPAPEGGADVDLGFTVTSAGSSEITHYPLSLAVAPIGGGLRLNATFDGRRLDASRVRTLLAAFETVVRRLASGEEEASVALDPLSAGEREKIVETWNETARPYPREAAHRLFEAHASSSPDAIAIRTDDGTWTYGEVNARANRLARRLRAMGVVAESRVGVSLERSADLVVALLAVLKAGGAYLPLDSDLPPARLEHMRRDGGVRVVIARRAAGVAAWAGDARVAAIDDERAAIEAESDADLADVEVDPEALAYVLYTSGSTGLPKGTAVPHRAVVRLVREQDFAAFGSDEVYLHLAPVAFDASTLEIWGALLNGGSIAVHPPTVPDPRSLGAFLQRHGVTAAWLTAGLFHQAVDEGLPGFGNLRRLLAGGDVLSPPHVARAKELLPRTVIVNGYGPTETTTFTACHAVRADDLDGGSIPIGKPLANARVYVLDAAMRPVPIGAPGELYVGGDGLARGYPGRAELTAEKFVPDPFAAQPGARLYRTGDLVRWTERGELDFVGRIDQQVKVRGFRVELGEVEAVLRAHPSVRDAVAVVRGEGSARRLVSYVAPADADVSAIKAHAADRLPEYMVPGAIVALEALPLTPNGKVDRRALPEPDAAGDGEPFIAPETPTEVALAAIWEELLGVEGVGAGHSFVALGGHSLLAMRLASEVLARLDVEMPLRAVFETPRLRDLAARIDRLRDEALAALLAELGDDLSPDELGALLGQ